MGWQIYTKSAMGGSVGEREGDTSGHRWTHPSEIRGWFGTYFEKENYS